MSGIDRRLTRLEAQPPARGPVWVHVPGETVDAWLARMLAAENMERWPAQRRDRMALQYRQTAETLRLMELGVL